MGKKDLVICRRLKGLMVEHEMTTAILAKKMGISENSLTLKINGRRGWWFQEAMLVTKIFGFTEVKDVLPELYNSVQKIS